VENDEKEFEAFLDKNIYSCKDFNEYIMKNGGIEKMRKLRRLEKFI